MSALLTVRGLVKEYPARSRSRDKAPLRAVNGIDLDVERGQTLAIVGESGSGKSTTGRAILRLIEATAGTIMFDGIDIRRLPTRELRALRSRMQIVFQDNGAALDPRWSVGRLLAEPLRRHEQLTRREQSRRIADMLDRVGLDPRHTTRYPHEFSGGQRQRIGIARALMVHPELVVCDEPVSALDVSVQAQVLNLMKDLQDEFGLTYLFISHDLSVVEFMADSVAVMSRGNLVESGPCSDIMTKPQHSYTRALLAAVPVPDPSVYADRAARRALIRSGIEHL
ncbi:MAG: hypothetical protein B5766_03365 [Candidatus Lumbricidophila eiseniae]|uniref:ABC transporter domain-containing protein n=1 Tax=Candidatus Lumbricidiphila eiseniae TaxID=1969409 RepID=A0A2A6FTH3_9MICO|nr:MAG: hypothetical protein B5766_03365 [Candidatus Lumbricidophila eiseniae]